MWRSPGPVTAGMDGPTWGTEEGPGPWPCRPSSTHTSGFTSQRPEAWIDSFNYSGPSGHFQACADAFHFLLLWALMPADITQQKISPGGISKTKPPTSLTLQELYEQGQSASFLKSCDSQFQELMQMQIYQARLGLRLLRSPPAPGWIPNPYCCTHSPSNPALFAPSPPATSLAHHRLHH